VCPPATRAALDEIRSDYPLITPDRWMKDFLEAGFKPEVHPLILKQNAMRLLNLVPASS
jgi:predicted TIM-barrel fold metal-dependent hydrolase